MPTGYTAGIIDGTTKTFQDFAKKCMRAFGATIHMREDSLSKDYEAREPDSYYAERLQNAKDDLHKAENYTDKELLVLRKKELNDDKKYHEKEIESVTAVRNRLNRFLVEAIAFVPPTDEHEQFADFMVSQLRDTIEHDGNTTYHDNALVNIALEINCIDVDKVRADLIASAKESIVYSEKSYKEELNRCTSSNKWVEDLLNVLN